MATGKAPRRDWAPVLRRQPNEIVYGRPHGGYTQAFEIICLGCGDHVDVDYRDAPLRFQAVAMFSAHARAANPGRRANLASQSPWSSLETTT